MQAGAGYGRKLLHNVYICCNMQTTVSPQQDPQELSQPFAPFYDNTAFSDIILKAEGTKVHAHKVVLAAHSPTLQAMFQVSCA